MQGSVAALRTAEEPLLAGQGVLVLGPLVKSGKPAVMSRDWTHCFNMDVDEAVLD